MSQIENTGSSGLGVVSILQIIFIVLKLTGNLDWNWWWVFSLIWIPAALFFVVFFTMFIVVTFLLLFGFKSEELKKYFDEIKQK